MTSEFTKSEIVRFIREQNLISIGKDLMKSVSLQDIYNHFIISQDELYELIIMNHDIVMVEGNLYHIDYYKGLEK